jgi:hypothetical protein
VDTARLERLVQLDDEKRDLEGKLSANEIETKELKAAIYKDMEESAVKSVKAHGRTIYLQRTIWAGAVNKDTKGVAEALRVRGMGDMITFNHNSLSGWVRELARENGLCDSDDRITGTEDEIHDLLPDDLKPIISVTAKTDVKVLKK